MEEKEMEKKEMLCKRRKKVLKWGGLVVDISKGKMGCSINSGQTQQAGLVSVEHRTGQSCI